MGRTKYTPEQMEKQKIEFFDRKVARDLGREVEDLLATHLSMKYSLKIRYRGGSYEPESTILKFEFIPKHAKNPEERTYIERAKVMSLPPLGATFSDESGHELKVAGFSLKARKNCIVLRRVSDNHRYKCSIDFLRQFFPDEMEIKGEDDGK